MGYLHRSALRGTDDEVAEVFRPHPFSGRQAASECGVRPNPGENGLASADANVAPASIAHTRAHNPRAQRTTWCTKRHFGFWAGVSVSGSAQSGLPASRSIRILGFSMLDQPAGGACSERRRFRALHSHSRALVDQRERHWTSAQPQARHGREPQAVHGLPLPDGFHWDVPRNRPHQLASDGWLLRHPRRTMRQIDTKISSYLNIDQSRSA